MKLYFDKLDYDDQLKRTVTAAYCGAADLGEMLVAAAAGVQARRCGELVQGVGRRSRTGGDAREAVGGGLREHAGRMVASVRVLAAGLLLCPHELR